MRVLCYTDTFLPLVGGAETVLDNLARQLTRPRTIASTRTH